MVLVDAAAQADGRNLAGRDAPAPAMQFRTPQDLFRLMYTSGTTDRPKGVMHSYENFYWKCMDHVIALGLSAQDRLLVVGPLYHVGAFDLPGMAVLWQGGMLCLLRDFEPASVLDSHRPRAADLRLVRAGDVGAADVASRSARTMT